MSSEIEYRNMVFSYTAAAAHERFKSLDSSYHFWPGHADEQHLVLCEHGASNCTMIRNGREVLERRWSALTLGTTEQVMRDFIEWSVDAEGGMLQRNGKWIKAEGYIAAWRKAVTSSTLPIQALAYWLQVSAVRISTCRLKPIEECNKHPWFRYKCDQGQILDRDEPRQRIALGVSNPEDLVCDLVMLSDLRATGGITHYPYASFIDGPNDVLDGLYTRATSGSKAA